MQVALILSTSLMPAVEHSLLFALLQISLCLHCFGLLSGLRVCPGSLFSSIMSTSPILFQCLLLVRLDTYCWLVYVLVLHLY